MIELTLTFPFTDALPATPENLRRVNEIFREVAPVFQSDNGTLISLASILVDHILEEHKECVDEIIHNAIPSVRVATLKGIMVHDLVLMAMIYMKMSGYDTMVDEEITENYDSTYSYMDAVIHSQEVYQNIYRMRKDVIHKLGR